jgi:hypothetical protein
LRTTPLLEPQEAYARAPLECSGKDTTWVDLLVMAIATSQLPRELLSVWKICKSLDLSVTTNNPCDCWCYHPLGEGWASGQDHGIIKPSVSMLSLQWASC